MVHRDDIEVFVSVVDAGGFTPAAGRLGITRSAVSRRIDGLEQRLGVRLLDRTTRHVGLTDAGDAFYSRCTRILEEIADAVLVASQYGGRPQGTLRITSAVMIGLYKIIPLLPAFIAAHTDLKVQLDLSDERDDPALEAHDVAITWGALPESMRIATKLTESRQIICAAPAYLERHGHPERPSDLADHNCLLISGLGNDRNEWYFETPQGQEVVKVTGSFTINSGIGAYEALIAGIGIGRVTDLRVQGDIRAGRLIPILAAFERREGVPIYAVHKSRRHVPPKVRALIDFLRDRLRGNAGAGGPE